MINRTPHTALTLMTFLVVSPSMAQPNFGQVSRPDVVLEWNTITLNVISTQNGVEQQRLGAITHLAMFEAVNAIEGDFKPYVGTIVAPMGASAEAAAVAAAHRVLRHYLTTQTGPLDEALKNSLARIPAGSARDAGVGVGEAAADALILEREGDGSQPIERYLPRPGEPGQWQQTSSCMDQGGLFLHWRNLKPFGIPRGDRFRADAPPELTSRRFARDYNEVKAVGGTDSVQRPPDRANVARFFAAVLSQGTWNAIAQQIVTAEPISLSDTTRLFALLNMAMNDALIAVIDSKYHYTLWRPETAIRAGDVDGNGDTDPNPGFVPFVTTPCHPSYPSAHASASYAARTVLDLLSGEREHAITLTSPAVPDVELRYTHLQQITNDIDDARIYGGIHFRFDQQAGATQGRSVGWSVVANNLCPSRATDSR